MLAAPAQELHFSAAMNDSGADCAAVTQHTVKVILAGFYTCENHLDGALELNLWALTGSRMFQARQLCCPK